MGPTPLPLPTSARRFFRALENSFKFGNSRHEFASSCDSIALAYRSGKNGRRREKTGRVAAEVSTIKLRSVITRRQKKKKKMLSHNDVCTGRALKD